MTPTPRDPARARRARRTLGVATGLVGAVLLAGCAAPLPTPQPDETQDPPPPVLTESQEAEVLDAVGAALTAAGEANDPALLDGRVTGPALAIRTSQLAVAAARGNSDLVTEIPTDVQQVIIPTTQTWARTSYAVSVQPENLQPPRLVALEQAGARDQYELWGFVQLLPGVTMPSFADPSIGSEAVAPDDDTLLVTPTDAVAQYVDVLNLGGGSGFAETFPDDALRQFLVAEAERHKAPLETAAGSRTMTFATTDEPVRAVRTADGGAMVMAALTSLETFQVEEGGTVSPPTETQKALFGETTPTNVLKVGYNDLVAMYVPPADSDETPRLLGYTHVATSIANQ